MYSQPMDQAAETAGFVLGFFLLGLNEYLMIVGFSSTINLLFLGGGYHLMVITRVSSSPFYPIWNPSRDSIVYFSGSFVRFSKT